MPGRLERKVVTLLAAEDPDKLHDALSQAGFRRSQDLAYRPACDDCSACVPVRVPVAEFTPGRTQRRILQENQGMIYRAIPALATREHYFLFRRYILARHGDGGMADMDFGDYRAMIEDSPVSTHLAEFRDVEGQLVGVCLTDRMGDGLSLVYSFFDPILADRSPGTAMILRQIEAARELDLPFVYMGYWIAESRKMAYKRKFRPLEALTHEGWQRLPDQATDTTS